jgi:hypothetical protein
VLRAFESQELSKGINHFTDILLTGVVDWGKYNDNCIKAVTQANQLHL